MEQEEWRAIPGFPGYEASTFGRISSLKRGERQVLRLSPDRYGYLRITLWTGGGRKSRRVHSWVTAAFLGPRAAGLVVRHLDGDQLNNRLSNLRYGTPSENVQDAIRHGVFPQNLPSRLGIRKEHCPKGHLYTAENSYIDPRGRKSCRTCRRAVNRAYMAARRAA